MAVQWRTETATGNMAECYEEVLICVGVGFDDIPPPEGCWVTCARER